MGSRGMVLAVVDGRSTAALVVAVLADRVAVVLAMVDEGLAAVAPVGAVDGAAGLAAGGR